MSGIDWPRIADPVARALLGEPNVRRSTACELRYGRRGSLVVHVAGERAGTWTDFEASEGGGVLAFIKRELGTDDIGALRWLHENAFVDADPAPRRPESRSEPRPGDVTNAVAPEAHASERAACAAPRRDTRAGARRIWRETRPIAGTVAERYLAARGVGHIAGTPALRFHPALSHRNERGQFPCLVAGIQDVDGQFLGIQRAYLAADGTGKAAVDPVRASLGSPAGGAVRLGEPEGGRLLVGEGIESTAAAAALFNLPGWATLGTSGLRAVVLPEHVRDVVIAADRDAKGGGQLAAAALAERFEAEGRRARVELPPFVADWNDVLRLARGAS